MEKKKFLFRIVRADIMDGNQVGRLAFGLSKALVFATHLFGVVIRA
ncbi:MAG: hypothetical protein LBL46_00230 [Rickettsiales bacterium]|nr:hypothetical protein [Rickettsiales bacterium]